MRYPNPAPENERGRRDYVPTTVAPALMVAEAVSALVALLVFVVTALLVADHLSQAFDVTVFHAVLSLDTPVGQRFAVALAVLGQNGITVGAIFLGFIFLFRRSWTALVVLVVVMAGAEGLDNLFKALFARPRPIPLPSVIAIQDYSFPSGHAVVSSAFFFLLAYLGWQFLGTWQRVIWMLVTMLLVFSVAFSRLYLGVHYFTDVVAGAALGFFWSDVVILGQQLIDRRRLIEPGETPDGR